MEATTFQQSCYSLVICENFESTFIVKEKFPADGICWMLHLLALRQISLESILVAHVKWQKQQRERVCDVPREKPLLRWFWIIRYNLHVHQFSNVHFDFHVWNVNFCFISHSSVLLKVCRFRFCCSVCIYIQNWNPKMIEWIVC